MAMIEFSNDSVDRTMARCHTSSLLQIESALEVKRKIFLQRWRRAGRKYVHTSHVGLHHCEVDDGRLETYDAISGDISYSRALSPDREKKPHVTSLTFNIASSACKRLRRFDLFSKRIRHVEFETWYMLGEQRISHEHVWLKGFILSRFFLRKRLYIYSYY